EHIRAAQTGKTDLKLLDFSLQDMKGDEVCSRCLESAGAAVIPEVYKYGYDAELQASPSENANVIGFLNKPFTSDLLIQTVETHMPRKSEEPEPTQPNVVEPTPATEADFSVEQEPAYREASEVGPEITQTQETPWWTPAPAN